MSVRLPRLPCALLAAAAALVAGCGGGDDEPRGRELPPSVADALLPQLESIGDRVAADVSGACDDIYRPAPDGNIEPIDQALAAIPANVDPEIRSALEQSVERLKQLVDQECAEIRAAERRAAEEAAPEETTPTETTPTETETAPPETTETATPETTETTPPATTPQPPATPPDGRGPTGTGPPGLERGGAEAPDDGDDD